MSEHTRSHDSSVYYTGRYWNDLPQVVAYLQRRATGVAGVRWFEHLCRRTGRTRFRKALILNCGNGWVERDLVHAGVVAEAVGIDIAADLLAEAEEAAAADGLPLRYVECDTNSARFPEDGYDLVVNYAAAHHIAYLDRVVREICRLLPPDGVFASWDYVGPHRNQYPPHTWDAAKVLNEELPPHLRSGMDYPHVPTMLATDPTEAIHSELVVATTLRYFDLDWYAPLGGALAYPILTFNDGVHDATPAERDPWVEHVIAVDDAYTRAHPESTLFAFFLGRPKKHVLADRHQLEAWTAEEIERETAAAQRGGVYYAPSGVR